MLQICDFDPYCIYYRTPTSAACSTDLLYIRMRAILRRAKVYILSHFWALYPYISIIVAIGTPGRKRNFEVTVSIIDMIYIKYMTFMQVYKNCYEIKTFSHGVCCTSLNRHAPYLMFMYFNRNNVVSLS